MKSYLSKPTLKLTIAGTANVRRVTTKLGKADGKKSFTYSGQKSKSLSH
jgi:hypothetical protein